MGERLIDIRGMLDSLRPKKVKGIPVGEQVKIVSEDKRIQKLARKTVDSMNGADFVKGYKGVAYSPFFKQLHMVKHL